MICGAWDTLYDWWVWETAAGEYRVRTGNLAQASRTRLSESGGEFA